ncbi:unnamed protein product [Scytosiphon promiscuus]
MDVADGVFGVSNPAASRLPAAQQPANRWETILPGITVHLRMTDERQPDHQADLPGDPFCDAAAGVPIWRRASVNAGTAGPWMWCMGIPTGYCR